MDIGDSLMVGIVASLIASITFFAVLLGMRPRFKISPQISMLLRDGTTEDYVYRLKVVNTTRRAMVDVQVRAYLDKPRKVPGGGVPIHVLKSLDLKTSQGGMIPGRRRKDQDARHARRFRLDSNLQKLWPNDQEGSVVLRVFCRDGVTGAFRQKEQRFPLHDCLAIGSFSFGDSLDVKPVGTRPTAN